MSAPLQVRCPTCRKVGPWFEGPYGPFCSARCKWVDLGRWLDEDYRISEPLAPELAAATPEEERPPENDDGVNDAPETEPGAPR